ncbi:MAG: type I glutamate--ammonia ligase [Geminicoccaceae bacterium]
MPDAKAVLERIKQEDVQTLDFRFTDLRGRWQHCGLAVGAASEALLNEGLMFDGSAIAGWRDVSQSDMLLKPDLASAVLDPFSAQATLIVTCEVVDPASGLGYERCPRSLGRRAEAHLVASQLADQLQVAPQAEFFIFDDVRFGAASHEAFWRVDAEEAPHNAATRYEVGNGGHRYQRGAPLAAPPADHQADLRAEIASQLRAMGLAPERQHHDTAPCQSQISLGFGGLLESADRLQLYKYAVQSVASAYGKSATFLPKPMAFEPGSGLMIQQRLLREGQPVFAGQGYADLSERCLHYIGGILHHARALNALLNPTTNSYRRLAPGSGAPRQLAYAALNRSAAVRLPFADKPEDKRVEVRFADPAANPYLAFAALLLAGLNGIARQIDPGEPMDRNLYDLPPEEIDELPTVCRTLAEALDALDADRAFLTVDEVFTDDLIDTYVALKRAEIEEVERVPHPVEFQLYYST